MNCIGYADDYNFANIHRIWIQVLIDICQQYAEHYCLDVNGDNSHYKADNIAEND